MKLSEDNNSYLVGLLIATIIVALISLVFIILEFVWFHACWANNLLILVPVLFAVGYVLCVIFKTRENGSLFTSAVMVLYLVYLNWTALASRPSDNCNPFYLEDFGTVLQVFFGLFFTFLTLVILACGVKSTKNTTENKFKDVVADSNTDDDEIDEENPKGEKKESHVFPVTIATLVFQGFMIFASIYYAMLMSNWGRPTVDDDNYDYFIDEWAAFWVKIVVQWIMSGLYLFSLLAPLIFPNREF